MKDRPWTVGFAVTSVILFIFLMVAVFSGGDDSAEELALCQADLAACSQNLTQTQEELNDKREQNKILLQKNQELAKKYGDLEKEKNSLKGEKTELEKETENLQNELEAKERELENCLKSSAVNIPPPQIAGSATHGEILNLLREVFPNAAPRGVEQISFELTSYSEVARFLQADDTNQASLQNRSDYVFRLIGNFSSAGWERVPVGWVKTSSESFYFIFIVKEGSELQIFGFLPDTDQPQRIHKDTTAKFVLVG